MKPHQTLIALLSVLAGLILIMAVHTLADPVDGEIKLKTLSGDTVTWRFYTFKEYFYPDPDSTKDMQDILDALEGKRDSIRNAELTQNLEIRRRDSIDREWRRIQFADQDPGPLYPFFHRLSKISGEEYQVRILHYGDSQLEGDRMTSVIRSELQRKFGGHGPGMTAPLPLVTSMSVNIESSENWRRYTKYGQRDSMITHNMYGPLFCFGRFAPPTNDPARVAGADYTGMLKVRPRGGSNTRQYDRVRLFAGNTTAKVSVKFVQEGEVVLVDSIMPGELMKEIHMDFEETPKELTILMSGKDSPDVYALSLEGKLGVVADNISMRGASGTTFGSNHRALLQQMYNRLQPDLLILQYGGNYVPYVKDVAMAERYGDDIKTQIMLLKRLIPGVSVILIGPADMSIQVKGKYVSHPMVEPVRNALKRAAFESGAGYYDMYHVMGGRNSMHVWVSEDPPLAAPDHIHFQPAGAKKVATAFMREMLDEYAKWKKAGKPGEAPADKPPLYKEVKKDPKAEDKAGPDKGPPTPGDKPGMKPGGKPNDTPDDAPDDGPGDLPPVTPDEDAEENEEPPKSADE